MNTELKKLSADDGADIYEMLQEMPADENGFLNSAYGLSYEEFKKWLVHKDNISKGIGLEDWMVPQNTYWLYANGIPVGYGKLCHRLTEKLRREGGHCGFSIRPGERNKGYGKILLKLIINEAAQMGIDKMLLTVYNHNEYSIKTILSCGGIIEKITDKRHLIWINCTDY